MTLSTHARRTLAVALKSEASADDFADIVDAGSGTLSTMTKTRLRYACANTAKANTLITSVNAGTALSGASSDILGIALADRTVAAEIAAALAL